MLPSSFDPPTAAARLVILDNQIHVEADQPDSLRAPLTPLLRSMLLRLFTVSDLFYLTHHRCLAGLLLLNLANGLWATRLPRQTCRADGVTWTNDLKPAAPGEIIRYVVAGSFQTTRNEDLLSQIPSCDGVHLVRHHVGAEDRMIIAIVAGGDRRIVSANEAIVDDYQQMLADAAGRMTLEPA